LCLHVVVLGSFGVMFTSSVDRGGHFFTENRTEPKCRFFRFFRFGFGFRFYVLRSSVSASVFTPNRTEITEIYVNPSQPGPSNNSSSPLPTSPQNPPRPFIFLLYCTPVPTGPTLNLIPIHNLQKAAAAGGSARRSARRLDCTSARAGAAPPGLQAST
jgi:hypothetical protein